MPMSRISTTAIFPRTGWALLPLWAALVAPAWATPYPRDERRCAGAGTVDIVEGERVVVQDGCARAVVQWSPLALDIEDAGSGEPVLRSLRNPLPVAVPQPVVNVDPELLGIDLLPETTYYAPLSFEVGVERNLQHPVLLWTGNMLLGAQGGIAHQATAVRSARLNERGDGVVLELTTTDPTRTLTLQLEPDDGDAIRVRVTPSSTAGISGMGVSFESGPDEAFYGFGGRHPRVNHRGQAFYNWVEEENINAWYFKPIFDRIPQAGGPDYMFPNGPYAAYYVQNLFMSSRPYGFLLNQTELTRWRLAVDRADAWQVRSRSASLDYSVAVGDVREVARSLGRINGAHRLPDEWAMGPTIKRAVQQGNESPESYTQKVLQDLEDFEFHAANTGLKLEGYSYEGWDSMDPQLVADINSRLKARGIRPIGYLRSYVNDDGVFDPRGTFADAIARDLCVETPLGTPYPGIAVGPACLLDFTKPQTIEWWYTRKLGRMLDLGFDGFMQDFGEQVQDDMVFANGETGVTMHNKFPIVYHRLTREFVDAYEAAHPERGSIFMYVRTGFSGRQGSVIYEHSNFPGDESTDWDTSTGLRSLAPDMLNRVIGGAFGFNTDIGGYFDQFAVDVLDDDLFGRWSQWAALTPYFRVHNSSGSGTKMPWVFENGGYDAWKTAADLHLEARPLTRALWRYGLEQGLPPTRPMWMAYPQDRDAAAYEQQWMLGEDVLVAPVVEKRATSKRVYLPAGTWARARLVDGAWRAGIDQDAIFRGPGEFTVPAPAGELPFFFRTADAQGRSTGVDGFATALARLEGGAAASGGRPGSVSMSGSDAGGGGFGGLALLGLGAVLLLRRRRG